MLLADNNAGGFIGERIDQHPRVGGHDELGPFRGLDQEFGEVGNHIRVEAKLGLFNCDERRRFGMEQDRQQA